MADDDAAYGAKPNPNEATAPAGYPGGDVRSFLGEDLEEDKKAPRSSLRRGPRASVDEDSPKVRFDAGRNTIASYAPSDSSEEWDPNNDDEEIDDPQAPKEIAGYLWKKSPSRMVFFKHQRRYFQLKNCKLTWWHGEDEFKKGRKHSKGTIDFKANNGITLANDDSSSTRFELKPRSGKWMTGNFTGATDGRVFYLDADGSGTTREEWAEAVNLHLNYANQQF